MTTGINFAADILGLIGTFLMVYGCLTWMYGKLSGNRQLERKIIELETRINDQEYRIKMLFRKMK